MVTNSKIFNESFKRLSTHEHCVKNKEKCFPKYLFSFQVSTNVSASLVNMAVPALTESVVTIALVSMVMRVFYVERVSRPYACPIIIIIVILIKCLISRNI